MVKPRVIESEGVMGAETVASYDKLMRVLMQKGYLDTSTILQTGIRSGHALEIGPGPGYLGIDWLSHTQASRLTGLDISPEMIQLAKHNAQIYQVQDRADYIWGDARQIPFADKSFDAVFSNGSLHEWTNPEVVLNEVFRVLRPGGRFCITDLRRDISLWARLMLQVVIPKERKAGFLSSLRASYTQTESKLLVDSSLLKEAQVTKGFWTLVISGEK